MRKIVNGTAVWGSTLCRSSRRRSSFHSTLFLARHCRFHSVSWPRVRQKMCCGFFTGLADCCFEKSVQSHCPSSWRVLFTLNYVNCKRLVHELVGVVWNPHLLLSFTSATVTFIRSIFSSVAQFFSTQKSISFSFPKQRRPLAASP